MALKLAVLSILGLVATVVGRSAYNLPDGAVFLLRTPLQTTFSCESRGYGFYADVANACQVFHVCVPVLDQFGNTFQTDQFSFVCGNQTVFSQEALQCVHEFEAYPCDQSESIFDFSNSDFGRIDAAVAAGENFASNDFQVT